MYFNLDRLFLDMNFGVSVPYYGYLSNKAKDVTLQKNKNKDIGQYEIIRTEDK